MIYQLNTGSYGRFQSPDESDKETSYRVYSSIEEGADIQKRI